LEPIFHISGGTLAIKSKQRILHSAELNDSEKRAILGDSASRLLRGFFIPATS
jgi:hypothetical protein